VRYVDPTGYENENANSSAVSPETLRQWEEYGKVNPLMKGASAGGAENGAPTAQVATEENTDSRSFLSKAWDCLTGDCSSAARSHVNEQASATAKKGLQADKPLTPDQQSNYDALVASGRSPEDAKNDVRNFGAHKEALAEGGGFAAGLVAQGGTELGLAILAERLILRPAGALLERAGEAVSSAWKGFRGGAEAASAEVNAAEAVASGGARSGFTGLSRDARRYLLDIERSTGAAVPPAQRAQLAEALRGRKFEKLTAQAAREHRAAFSKVKSDLIAEWEQQTRQQWPRYGADVVNDRGVVLRRAGQPFDAHHVIESGYGGPNEWWNIHPAEFPGGHQGGVHRSTSASRGIFR
jgi:hypothetical protein